jgi:membrane protein
VKHKVKAKIASLQDKWEELQEYSAVQFALKTFKRFKRLEVMEMAASTSYYMLFAIFPFLIIMLMVLVSILAEPLQTGALDISGLASILPSNFNEIIRSIVRNIQMIPISRVLSIGIVSFILASSKGFGVVVTNIDRIYGRKRSHSNMLLSRLFGLILMIALGLMILGIMFLLMVIQFAYRWIQTWLEIPLDFIDSWGNILSFLILALMFGLLLYFMSGRTGKKRYAFFCGAGMGIAINIVSIFFSVSMSGSQKYTVFYGSFAGLMLTLLWIFVSAIIIYTGTSIHAMILDYTGTIDLATRDAKLSYCVEMFDENGLNSKMDITTNDKITKKDE